MQILKKTPLLFILLVVVLEVNGQSEAPFPHTAQVAKTLYVGDLPQGDDSRAKGLRLALLSLQGLVNRNKPQIYLKGHINQDYLLDFYKQKGYYRQRIDFTDTWKLIAKFKKQANGIVVFDLSKPYTINIATDVAGVDNLLITSPEYIEAFKKLGLKVITDLRTVPEMRDTYSAYQWACTHYWSRQRHDVLSNVYYNYQFDVNRDYLIAYKIPALWLPSKNDADYSVETEDLIRKIYAETPLNIPVLGFWQLMGKKKINPGNNDDPKYENVQIGPGEYTGVKFAGEYGKFTLVSDWAGNYSYHTGIPVDFKKLRQKTAVKTIEKPNPEKKYVAVTMIESGDSPGYYQYAFYKDQWSDKSRGAIACNFSISPMLQYLLPGLVEYLYETASPSDYFFASISGMGYMYPLEGYGSKTTSPEQTLSDYYKKTSNAMRRMDLNMLGVYTHPRKPWSGEDEELIEKCIIPNMPGLKAVLPDMGRLNSMTPATANYITPAAVPVFHCLSRWPDRIPGDSPDNTANDEATVSWLVNEIKTNSSGGQFLHMMAYSWIYGPRRLKMVAARLKPQGFEFVNLNEFAQLYRQANNR